LAMIASNAATRSVVLPETQEIRSLTAVPAMQTRLDVPHALWTQNWMTTVFVSSAVVMNAVQLAITELFVVPAPATRRLALLVKRKHVLLALPVSNATLTNAVQRATKVSMQTTATSAQKTTRLVPLVPRDTNLWAVLVLLVEAISAVLQEIVEETSSATAKLARKMIQSAPSARRDILSNKGAASLLLQQQASVSSFLLFSLLFCSKSSALPFSS